MRQFVSHTLDHAFFKHSRDVRNENNSQTKTKSCYLDECLDHQEDSVTLPLLRCLIDILFLQDNRETGAHHVNPVLPPQR